MLFRSRSVQTELNPPPAGSARRVRSGLHPSSSCFETVAPPIFVVADDLMDPEPFIWDEVSELSTSTDVNRKAYHSAASKVLVCQECIASGLDSKIFARNHSILKTSMLRMMRSIRLML